MFKSYSVKVNYYRKKNPFLQLFFEASVDKLVIAPVTKKLKGITPNVKLN